MSEDTTMLAVGKSRDPIDCYASDRVYDGIRPLSQGALARQKARVKRTLATSRSGAKTAGSIAIGGMIAGLLAVGGLLRRHK